MPLPDVDHAEYWRLHALQTTPGDNGPWAGALERIASSSGFAPGGLLRADAGRNVVFIGADVVVKLIPPFWRHMGGRERVALDIVYDGLELRTPRLIASGTVGSWMYLVIERLGGHTAGRGTTLTDGVDGAALARWQGSAAAVLGQMEPQPALEADWKDLIDEQRSELDLGALPTHLADTAQDYIDSAGDLTAPTATFLHGDLASVNVLIGDEMALIDWSDAVNGPAEHELISPFMHQFRGEPSLIEAFWLGYGPVDRPGQLQHRAMARSILKYHSLLPRYLADLSGAMPAGWEEAASRFYRLA